MPATDFDQRREHLLATAANVFAAKGFHPTTMRDLARATGMSLAGMYHYVRSKEELLYLVQIQCFRAVVSGAEAAIEDAQDPAERLRRLIEHHVAFFVKHMDEMKVLSHEAGSLHGAHREAVDALKRRYLDLTTTILAACGTSGDGAEPSPRVAALALFGMMNWIYTWYDPAGPVSARELAEQFTQLALQGVGAGGATSAL